MEQHSTFKHGMDGEGRSTEGCSCLELVHLALPVKGYVKSDGIYFALSRTAGHYLDKNTFLNIQNCNFISLCPSCNFNDIIKALMQTASLNYERSDSFLKINK